MSQLPEDYVVSKFFEYGTRPKYDRSAGNYICGCPICKEGKSLHKKRRCVYLIKEDLIYCHNCGWSSRPMKWICEAGRLTRDEVKAEIQEGDFFDCVDTLIKRADTPTDKKVYALPFDSINLFDPVQVDFYKDNKMVQEVLRVIKERRIDTAVNRPKAVYTSLKDFTHRHRLVIPYFNENGIKVDFYQTRKVFSFDEKERYISKQGGTRSIFNIDQVNIEADHVFIFEGPIDAMFVRNGVAVGGINEGRSLFNQYQQQQVDSSLAFHKKIWVLDSQWQDEASRIKTEILLNQDACVYIWPHSTGSRYKDLNELCVDRGINGIRGEFLLKETYKGEQGLEKLKTIRNCLRVEK